MLGVNKGRNASVPLDLGDRMKGKGRFTGRFRTINFRNPSPGDSADTQGFVQGQGSR